MENLKLVPANENRITGNWSADDYDVVLVETGKTVGRIYGKRNASGTGQEWFWGLDFFHARNTRSVPYYGVAESKEAAKRAFAERWRGERVSENGGQRCEQ